MVIMAAFICACGAKTGLNEPRGPDADVPRDVPADVPRDVPADTFTDTFIDTFIDTATDIGGDACTPERCNGVDDDCDGVVDDGLFCFFLDGERVGAAARGECGPRWYSYDFPDGESANPTPDIRVSDEVVVAVQAGEGACGAYIAVIADLPMDGSGGALLGRFDITEGSVDGVAVGDEPRECDFDGRNQIVCDWVWQPCCTDGVLVGPFRDDFCVTLTLSGASGIRAINALDGAPDRRRPLREGVPAEFCGRFEPRR